MVLQRDVFFINIFFIEREHHEQDDPLVGWFSRLYDH